jgi:hypothetical protein
MFEADRFLMQQKRSNAITHLTEFIKTKRSQGVFAQLRHHQVDSNPLDIRQRAPPGYDESYVEKGEQEKRIRPIDSKLSTAKYTTVMKEFGWDSTDGTTVLNLNVSCFCEQIKN